jgi:hypothetical protein
MDDAALTNPAGISDVDINWNRFRIPIRFQPEESHDCLPVGAELKSRETSIIKILEQCSSLVDVKIPALKRRRRAS